MSVCPMRPVCPTTSYTDMTHNLIQAVDAGNEKAKAWLLRLANKCCSSTLKDDTDKEPPFDHLPFLPPLTLCLSRLTIVGFRLSKGTD